MEVEINWLAVVLATAVGMGLAGIWYTKATFGPVWSKLTGVTAEDSKKAGAYPMLSVLVANFITAVVLTGAIYISSTFFANDSAWHALLIGFTAWLAFSATTLVPHNAFELKPAKLTLINNGYQLVLFLSMALVIGLLGT